MKQYVVGFAIDYGMQRLALIRKNRPEWQRGLLNGIGGHVEPGEAPRPAVVREFHEETGHRTSPSHWDLFLTISGEEFKIWYYRIGFTSSSLNTLRSTTDEKVGLYDLRFLFSDEELVPDLSWVIPLAVYRAGRYRPINVESVSGQA